MKIVKRSVSATTTSASTVIRDASDYVEVVCCLLMEVVRKRRCQGIAGGHAASLRKISVPMRGNPQLIEVYDALLVVIQDYLSQQRIHVEVSLVFALMVVVVVDIASAAALPLLPSVHPRRPLSSAPLPAPFSIFHLAVFGLRPLPLLLLSGSECMECRDCVRVWCMIVLQVREVGFLGSHRSEHI